MEAAGFRRANVRDGKVGALAVDCRSPLNATPDGSFAGMITPEFGAFLVRIERERVAGLLRGDDDVAAGGGGDEHGRRAEVEIGSGLLAASAINHAVLRVGL